MALVTLFFVLPVLFTLWMSLHKWPLLGEPAWIGLRNYTRCSPMRGSSTRSVSPPTIP